MTPVTAQALNITIDYFLALFDEFKSVPSTKLEVYIELATMRVNKTAWGYPSRDTYKPATAYLAAHMLVSGGGASGPSTGTGGASGGALTQEAVGDLSRSFGTVGEAGSRSESEMTTKYGQQYIALRRENIVGLRITGRPPYPPGTVAGDGCGR